MLDSGSINKRMIQKLTVPGLQLSLLVSIALNLVFTLAKESYSPLKGFLHDIFGNSWLGQLSLLTLFFLMMFVVFSSLNLKISFGFSKAFSAINFISVIVLFLFYAFTPGK